MKIVSVSGLDGSGKTSQIEMLKNELEKDGQKVFYFHAVNFSVGKFFHNVETRHWRDSTGREKAKTSANFFKVFLRKIALLIDIARFSYLYRKLAKEYDYILTDRYFYDQIVNILYLENKTDMSFFGPAWWQKMAENYIIKPDVPIYLQARPEIILQRDREIEQGKDYLDTKKKIYDFMGRRWGLKFINGEKETGIVSANIKGFLNSPLNSVKNFKNND